MFWQTRVSWLFSNTTILAMFEFVVEVEAKFVEILLQDAIRRTVAGCLNRNKHKD